MLTCMKRLEADPDFALAQVALARGLLLKAQVPEARAAAARARELAARATPREREHIHALALAIDAMVLAPATGVFGRIGFSGRQEREAELYEFLRSVAPAYSPHWWFDSMLAFAACEFGRLEEARTLIERSMAVNPRHAHGAHIKVHVLYEGGEPKAGLDYLNGWMPGFDREGLLHCHLSWHVAIFALALGRRGEAWQAYRSAVHPGGSWGPPLNVVSDSASFLWRAELLGEPRQPELWRDVQAYARARFPQPGISFADVHAALSCIANADAAALGALIDELRERVAAGRLPAGSVVPLLAEGLSAYGAGQWSRAIEILGKALPETVRIGGSRAQRDLVARTLAAAYLRAGRDAEALTLLSGRPA